MIDLKTVAIESDSQEVMELCGELEMAERLSLSMKDLEQTIILHAYDKAKNDINDFKAWLLKKQSRIDMFFRIAGRHVKKGK